MSSFVLPLAFAAVLVTESLAFADDPASPPPASPPPASPASDGTETITVKLDSNREGTLLERRANRVRGWQLTLPLPSYVVTEQWEPVCYAPCTVKLDANSMYSIGGASAASSALFGLPRGHDPLVLHVHAGSSVAYTVGIVTTILGVASTITGGAIALAALTNDDPVATQNFRYSGVGVLASGVVATVVGAILWAVNRTKVVTDDGHVL